MFREKKRWGQDPTKVVRSKPRTFNLPRRLKPGTKVFVCSWSDFFHPEADKWRAEAVEIMQEREDLTFLIPTKRIERVARLPSWPVDGDRKHIWLGVSIENQETANKRIPELLNLDWPGITWVSAEPLLGPIDLREWLNPKCKQCEGEMSIPVLGGGAPCPRCIEHQGLDPRHLVWVVVGGESGSGARPCHPRWVRRIRDDCRKVAAPFFFKQWGEFMPGISDLDPDECGYRCKDAYIDDNGQDVTELKDWHKHWTAYMWRVGKKAAGAMLDGREWREFPKEVRVP